MKQLLAWYDLSLKMAQMSMDASSVIALRTAKIAAGGTAGARESHQMVDEKIAAFWELQASLLFSGRVQTAESATRRALSIYGKKVHANRERLTRRP